MKNDHSVFESKRKSSFTINYFCHTFALKIEPEFGYRLFPQIFPGRRFILGKNQRQVSELQRRLVTSPNGSAEHAHVKC